MILQFFGIFLFQGVHLDLVWSKYVYHLPWQTRVVLFSAREPFHYADSCGSGSETLGPCSLKKVKIQGKIYEDLFTFLIVTLICPGPSVELVYIFKCEPEFLFLLSNIYCILILLYRCIPISLYPYIAVSLYRCIHRSMYHRCYLCVILDCII